MEDERELTIDIPIKLSKREQRDRGSVFLVEKAFTMTISDLNGIISTILVVATTVITTLFIIFRKKISRPYLITVSVILAIFIVPYLGLIAYISHTTVVAVNGSTKVSSLGNLAPTDTPYPTIGPTATPTTIQEDIPIPCSACVYPLNFILKQIVINKATDTTSFAFSLTNNDTAVHYYYFDKDKLILLDSSGHSIIGGGDGFGSFSLGPTNSTIVTPTFPFIPKHGSQYTLSVMLNAGSYVLKDQNITFP